MSIGLKNLDRYNILLVFPVMHCGWDMDERGWVVEDASGTRFLVLSSHGGLYLAEAEELRQKIAEYESVLAASRCALEILDGAVSVP